MASLGSRINSRGGMSFSRNSESVKATSRLGCCLGSDVGRDGSVSCKTFFNYLFCRQIMPPRRFITDLVVTNTPLIKYANSTFFKIFKTLDFSR